MPLEDHVELELDDYSKLTMGYTPEGLKELENDIKRQGQLEKITLHNGKILDGRHRRIACENLGIPVKYAELKDISDSSPLDYVISKAKSKDTNSSAAKIEAYLMCKAKGIKNKDMPKLFDRLNKNYIEKISFIEKHEPAFLQKLLQQQAVKLHAKKYSKLETCNTINSIWRILKDNKAVGDVDEVFYEATKEIDYDITVEEYFDNPRAESQYWEDYRTAREEGSNLHPSSKLGIKYMKYLKYYYDKAIVS